MSLYTEVQQLKKEGKNLQEVVNIIKKKYPDCPIVIIVAVYYAV